MSAVSALESPLLWTSDLSRTQKEFTLGLDTHECAEIKAALADFKAKKLDFHDVSPETFPLPQLKSRLTKASEDLHTGKGFFTVTGLNIDSLSAEDSTVLYLGLASYIGDKQGLQNKDGEVMIHVIDAKHWTVPHEQRHGIHSQKSLPFHNDMGGDILSLQARASAKTGGSTYLASAWTIYNDLVQNKPDIVEILSASNWPIQVSGSSKYILAPLMQMHDGKLVTSVDPARLGPHPKSIDSGVPKLSPKQVAALDALDESAKKNEIEIPLQKGEMLFLNNWAILHRRDSYKDDRETSRHLVRLWSRNTKMGWDIPENMAAPWKAAFEREDEKVYNYQPAAKYTKPEYTAGSAAFVIEGTNEKKAWPPSEGKILSHLA